MLIVHIDIEVKPDSIPAFIEATLANARESVREPGIAQFDFFQEADQPHRFRLIEVYRQPEAALAHKETAHYQKWRDTVAEMMAVPRVSRKFKQLP